MFNQVQTYFNMLQANYIAFEVSYWALLTVRHSVEISITADDPVLIYHSTTYSSRRATTWLNWDAYLRQPVILACFKLKSLSGYYELQHKWLCNADGFRLILEPAIDR